MKQQCPDCASGGVFGVGNGKCSNCYGGGKVGTIADDIAGGKRSCPQCHGTGKCKTCGGSGLVSGSTAPARPYAYTEVNPFDDKVAVRVHCPKCGAPDWLEWKFLGKLTDPVCGHTWYVGSGFYTAMQIRAIFRTSARYAKHGTQGPSGEGAWIGKILGAFGSLVFGFCIRLEGAAFMIPIQAIVGLCQPNKEKSEVVSRSIVVGVFAVAAGIGIYALHQTIKPLPAIPRQTTVMAVPSQQVTQVQDAAAPSQQVTEIQNNNDKKAIVRPSFDCAKARTAVELLICRDGHLASLEVGMASAYNQALSRLPDDGRKALKQQHLTWFRNYSRTCNHAANDNDRAICVASFLSARTTELNNQRQ
jgi:uncharacterized protein YecT (DUF1311 family)